MVWMQVGRAKVMVWPGMVTWSFVCPAIVMNLVVMKFPVGAGDAVVVISSRGIKVGAGV